MFRPTGPTPGGTNVQCTMYKVWTHTSSFLFKHISAVYGHLLNTLHMTKTMRHYASCWYTVRVIFMPNFRTVLTITSHLLITTTCSLTSILRFAKRTGIFETESGHYHIQYFLNRSAQ